MRRAKVFPLHRFLVLAIVSVALMAADHRGWLASARATAATLKLPFYHLINLPDRLGEWLAAHYPDDQLYQQYRELQQQQLRLTAELQRYEAVRAENRRLKELLSVSRKSEKQALLAEIMQIGLTPYPHRLTLNRGLESGVYLGQPVISAAGVLGQVSQLGVRHSVVTLLTNPDHSIPAQVRRNGLLAIARGGGRQRRVDLPFLPAHADIRAGDVLVTSGLGGRFPPGYKIARVLKVRADADQAFLTVYARPFAAPDMAREVLLLWNDRPDAAAVEPAARAR